MKKTSKLMSATHMAMATMLLFAACMFTATVDATAAFAATNNTSAATTAVTTTNDAGSAKLSGGCELEMFDGNTYYMDTYLDSAENANDKIHWTSSNPDVVSINANGVAEAKTAGTATITAKNGVSSTSWNIKIATVLPRLNLEKVVVVMGYDRSLYVENSSQKVTWTSSDTNVLEVTAEGKLIGKKVGSAIVTAEIAGKTAEAQVKVTSAIDIKQKALTRANNEFIDFAETQKQQGHNVKVTATYIAFTQQFSRHYVSITKHYAMTETNDEAHTDLYKTYDYLFESLYW